MNPKVFATITLLIGLATTLMGYSELFGLDEAIFGTPMTSKLFIFTQIVGDLTILLSSLLLIYIPKPTEEEDY